jgi:SET domain-containing protein
MTDAANGALICEYTGEIITASQANERRKLSKAQPQYFAKFEVAQGRNPNSDRTLTEIDAQHYGSFARFANHSCAPNSRLSIFTTPLGERLALQVNTPGGLKSGTAITIDYGWTFDPKVKPTKCLCQTSKCRGFIDIGTPAAPAKPKPTDSRSIVLNFIKRGIG